MTPHDPHRLMRSLSTRRVEVPFSARFHFATPGRKPGCTPVERLRMVRSSKRGVMAFEHRPVMLDEILEILAGAPPGVVLDATVGGAGHAKALLERAPHLSVVAVDRDPAAVEAATEALAPFADRAVVARGRFDGIASLLDSLGVGALSGALFDLGVSSPQLDRPERGFSYRAEGPLDMRMDPAQATTAADVVNGWAPADLAALFREHGETRFARRIAQAVVAARPISSTTQLAGVVKAAIPAAARRRGGHPARRAFQAVRAAVNDELAQLPVALDAALARLAPGGRVVVVSYHSGEDRLVKERFRVAASGGCTCPPALPCVCGARPTVRLLTRGARKPAPGEVAANHRAGSARLRAVEALGDAS